MRKYDLPRLSQLHTFEAVARHASFTQAAAELCLTQSAVSRQVKALEFNLGTPLFHRRHRHIELTEDGERLFDAVTRGLNEIETCITALRKGPEWQQITVAASVAFSYFWLMPRIERFSEQHPEIDLRVLATDQMVDLNRDDADIAVLYGDGNWTAVEARWLFGERVYPVCSPCYLEKHPELRQASDIHGQTLLHLEGGGNIWGALDWPAYLVSQGVSGRLEGRGIKLNSYPMVLQGAESGRGLALGWSYITDEMVQENRLVRPFSGEIETQNGYYIGASDRSASRPAVACFMDWISQEVSDLAFLA